VLSDLGFTKRLLTGRAASLLGSTGFMAQEVLDGRPYDYRVDIYAWGVCVYCMDHGSYDPPEDPVDMCKVVNIALHVSLPVYWWRQMKLNTLFYFSFDIGLCFLVFWLAQPPMCSPPVHWTMKLEMQC